MMISTQEYNYPMTTIYDETWDEEWARDWKKIVEIFATVDHLERLFNSLTVSYLRELSQKQIILHLQKYAYSLSKDLIQKYK
jgi:hypothetical protein